MGVFAEDCVAKYQFTREAHGPVRDRLDRARARRPTRTAASPGRWRRSRVPGKAGDTVIKFDEQPFKAKLDKIPGLKPAFKKDGTITAATSSSISDGAAALVLMRESHRGAARRRSRSRASSPTPCTRRRPSWFTTAPVGAIEKVLKKAGWERQGRRPVGGQRGLRRGDDGGDDRVQAAARDRQRARRRRSRSATRSAPAARASSSRCSARCSKRGQKKGVAALCIGGGEATALARRAGSERRTPRRSPSARPCTLRSPARRGRDRAALRDRGARPATRCITTPAAATRSRLSAA